MEPKTKNKEPIYKTLMDLEKSPGVVAEDVLKEFDTVCCVRGLIVTCN